MTSYRSQTETDLDGVFDVIVIGGGQAGLAMAWHLQRRGLRFLVLDAGPEIGHVWRSRWDSLTLFTPARYSALPGLAFPGEPDSYPSKEAVADYLRRYAETFRLPVRTNSPVIGVTRHGADFHVRIPAGTIRTQRVVVATGPFQAPVIPAAAAGLTDSVIQLHSSAYRNPGQLPDGPVLVVGGGNSGRQIAHELAATRPVHLSVGTQSPALPQRLLGRDIFWWLTRTGVLSKTAGSRLGRRIRARGELVIGTSRRRLRRASITIHPRVTGSQTPAVTFTDGTTLAPAAVVWATGFRSDYSWLNIPGALTDRTPTHQRGISNVEGLYFLGLAWQHTRGSALLGFVDKDADHIADHIITTVAAKPRPTATRAIAARG